MYNPNTDPAFLSSYPNWSAIMILLDALVLFALAARRSEGRAAM